MASSIVRQCADLIAVIFVAVALCGAVVISPFGGSPLVTVFSLSLALFLPGYALLAALFPEDGDGPVAADADLPDTGVGFYQDAGIDIIERIVFSIVVSVIVTPLLGLLLDTTSYGVRRVSVAVALTTVIVVASFVGIARRASIPPEERFSIWPYLAEQRQQMKSASGPAIAANAMIVVFLLLAVSGAIYAAHGADEGETFTELYMLSETDDGDLINEIPEQFVSNETHSIHIGVGNLEQTETNYTVVVQLERVDHDSGQVEDVEPLDRYERSLEHGDESVEERQFNPTMRGERLRLAVLLYKNEPPSEPTIENTYRDVYAWVDVVEGESE